MPICRNCSRSPVNFLIAAALGVAGVTAAPAATVLELSDAGTATARISIKDPTRIRVEGARITDVLGSGIRTDRNEAGSLTVSGDAAKGEVYLQPVDGHIAGTSVFVVTERATYTLILVPADIPADTVTIRDRQASVARAPGRLAAHEREMIRMLKSVAGDRVTEFRVVELNQPVLLWEGTKFTLVRRYEGHPYWRVDAYLLTNTSPDPMVLDEREFLTAGVAAVGLEAVELPPGATTTVRVVREAGEARR